MIKKQILLLTLFLTSLSAFADNKTITYTAYKKLNLKSTDFTPNFTNHDFEAGTGTITFPSDVLSINDFAFYDTGLETITLPETVTYIGDYAFNCCPVLTSITIPKSVTSIGEGAFATCGLKSITFPENSSLSSIGDFVCNACSLLTTITLPESVTSIGEKVFNGCSSLESFYGKFASEDHCCLIVDGTLKYFAPNAPISKFTIPESVTSIGDESFYDCIGLESIIFPENLTSIGKNAFYRCSGLTSISLPESVTTIEEGAFNTCFNLESFSGKYATEDHCCLIVDGTLMMYAPKAPFTSYTIPETVTSIGKDAFSGAALATISIPETVTSIEEGAITCLNLKTFYGKYATEDHCCLIVDGNLMMYAPKAPFTSYTIPETVTYIGNYAFSGADLATIIIPETVTSIGKGAFQGCTSLSSITIPNSVSKIETLAFNYCPSLESISIPESVKFIGDLAFISCLNLKKITFEGMPEIESSLFDGFGGYNPLQKVFIPAAAINNENFNENLRTCLEEFSGEFGYILTDAGYTSTSEESEVDMVYSRTVSTDNWMGVCLPFDLEYSDWSELGVAAILTSVTSESLDWTVLGSEATIEAGTPFIFKPNEAGTVKFQKTSATLKSASCRKELIFGDVTLTGTYETKTDMADTHAYALSNGAFYYTTDNYKTLNPYRIYLTVSEPLKRPAIPCRINGVGTTELVEIEAEPVTAPAPAVNLQGVRVGKDYKGLVIENGKVVIRK